MCKHIHPYLSLGILLTVGPASNFKTIIKLDFSTTVIFKTSAGVNMLELFFYSLRDLNC